MPKENIFSGKYEPDKDTCTEANESNVARFRTAMLKLDRIHYGIWLSNNFLFEKLRKRNIEQKRHARFLAYRELCIFVNKYF